MSQDKLLDTVNVLTEGTKDAEIKWQVTADEDAFRAILPQGLVRVERYDDPYARAGHGAVPITTGLPFVVPKELKTIEGFIYCMVVLDSMNRVLARMVPVTDEQATGLKNLWGLASQSARNSAPKLDDIFSEIAGKLKKDRK